MRRRSKKNLSSKVVSIAAALCALLGIGTGVLPGWLSQMERGSESVSEAVRWEETGRAQGTQDETANQQTGERAATPADLDSIPEYSGAPYIVIGDNRPDFSKEDMTTTSFEQYSELDSLGRCGVTYACLGQDLMPTEDRENISHVKPSGWMQEQYDFVEGKSLYNRCHLIGFQLAGENANEKNLITGTRYMNTIGMLPFENMVADYIKETDNHVLYRVTPIYEGDNLVASGVQMEACSVEDEGGGICFNVFAYNVQPGVEIDYATGGNKAAPMETTDAAQN